MPLTIYLGIFNPCGTPRALLRSLLVHHAVHQLAVIDSTAELLTDLSRTEVNMKNRHIGHILLSSD